MNELWDDRAFRLDARIVTYYSILVIISQYFALRRASCYFLAFLLLLVRYKFASEIQYYTQDFACADDTSSVSTETNSFALVIVTIVKEES